MEMTFRGREQREFKKKITAEILKDTRKDFSQDRGANEIGYKAKKIKPCKEE